MNTERCLAFAALTIALWGWVGDASADQPRYIRQSVRALGMGNAFTAVSDDEYALFYNPAGLQNIQKGRFTLLGLGVQSNQTTLDLSTVNPSNQDQVLQDLVGKRIEARVDLSALSYAGKAWDHGFGWALFGNGVVELDPHNPVVPYFDVNAYIQSGAVFGWSTAVPRWNTDFGFNLKSITRQGVVQTIHIIDAANGLGDQISNEAKTPHTAYGADLGANYRFTDLPFIGTLPPTSRVTAGMVLRDAPGLDFGPAGTVPTTLDTGVAWQWDVKYSDLIFSADYQDVTASNIKSTDPLRRIKLGAEAGFWRLFNGHPFFSVRAGLNNAASSWGFGLNLFGINIDYAEWTEELGSVAGDRPDSRKALELTFVF